MKLRGMHCRRVLLTVADAIYISTDGANTCTRCVPNFRECALILSKPSYLRTDKLHFLTVWITNVAKIDFALSHMFRRRICRTRLASLPAAPAVRCSARRTRRHANNEFRSLSADAAHTAKVLLGEGDVYIFDFHLLFFYGRIARRFYILPFMLSLACM